MKMIFCQVTTLKKIFFLTLFNLSITFSYPLAVKVNGNIDYYVKRGEKTNQGSRRRVEVKAWNRMFHQSLSSPGQKIRVITGESSYVVFLVHEWIKCYLGPKTICDFQKKRMPVPVEIIQGRMVLECDSLNRQKYHVSTGRVFFSGTNGKIYIDATDPAEIVFFVKNGTIRIRESEVKNQNVSSYVFQKDTQGIYRNGDFIKKAYYDLEYDKWFFAYYDSEKPRPGYLKEIHKW